MSESSDISQWSNIQLGQKVVLEGKGEPFECSEIYRNWREGRFVFVLKNSYEILEIKVKMP